MNRTTAWATDTRRRLQRSEDEGPKACPRRLRLRERRCTTPAVRCDDEDSEAIERLMSGLRFR